MLGVRAMGPGVRLSKVWPILVAAPLLGVLVALVAVVASSIVPAIVGIVALGFATRWLAQEVPEQRRWIGAWTAMAFVLHILIGLLIWHIQALTSFFGGDALTYDAGGQALADSWRHLVAAPLLPAGKEGFFYLLAALDFVFGQHVDAGIALNAAMGALIVPLTTDTARRLHGPGAARIAAPLATLVPGLVFWPAQLLREAGVLMLIALALNAAARISRRFSVPAMLAMAGALALLFTFRASTALLVATGLAAGVLLGRRRITGGVGASAGVLGLLVVLVLVFGLGVSGFRFVTGSNLATVNGVRADSSFSAHSGYAPDADVSTGSRAVSYLPFGMVAFLFGPPPWTITGFRQFSSLPDLLVWWGLLPSLLIGILKTARERGREVLLELLPALAVSAGLSLLIANFGTTIRERMQVVIILLPVIAYGLAGASPGRWRPNRAASHPRTVPWPQVKPPY